eukprot:scaffold1446_cov391-Prasinococcus_capsulatus_cf.AAC.6
MRLCSCQCVLEAVLLSALVVGVCGAGLATNQDSAREYLAPYDPDKIVYTLSDRKYMQSQCQEFGPNSRPCQFTWMPLLKFVKEQKHTFNTTGCSRCAVVGSAGSLLYGRARGGEIDAHDCIFRSNNPPTPSHLHSRVGSRTDFQLVWCNYIFDADGWAGVKSVFAIVGQVREPVPSSLQRVPERLSAATRYCKSKRLPYGQLLSLSSSNFGSNAYFGLHNQKVTKLQIMHRDVKAHAMFWKQQVAKRCGHDSTSPPSTGILA